MWGDILRNFRRSQLTTFVNIVGLTLGLAIAIMLLLFVLYERSYDKHIKDVDRIVCLSIMDEEFGELQHYPKFTRRGYTDLPDMVPGVESATLIYNDWQSKVTSSNDDQGVNLYTLATQSDFIEVFGLKMLAGNKKGLDNPSGAIITEQSAQTIFGGIEQALEKKIFISGEEYTVYGVVEALPSNTHFKFDILRSVSEEMNSWGSIEFYIYYKLKKNAPQKETIASIESAATQTIREFYDDIELEDNVSAVVENLSGYYLNQSQISQWAPKEMYE